MRGARYQGHGPAGGMTLRDYFAAAALQGLLNGISGELDAVMDKNLAKALAMVSHVLADAMLAERAKR